MSFDTVFDVMIGGFQYEIAYKCEGLRFTESGVILTDCLDEFGNKLDIESVEVRNAPIVIEKKTIQHEQEVKQCNLKN